MELSKNMRSLMAERDFELRGSLRNPDSLGTRHDEKWQGVIGIRISFFMAIRRIHESVTSPSNMQPVSNISYFLMKASSRQEKLQESNQSDYVV